MSLRSRVLSLARTLAGEGIGTPPPPDDRFYAITEGRPRGVGLDGTGYSWCGDFASYVLMTCGLYDPNMINRVRVRGKWYPGMNIAMIDWGSDYYGAKRAGDDALRLIASCTGDAGGHVVVMVRDDGGHIGFIDQSVNNTTYWSLDGNGPYGKTGRNLRDMGGLGRVAYVVDLDVVERRSTYYVPEGTDPPIQPAVPLDWPHSLGHYDGPDTPVLPADPQQSQPAHPPGQPATPGQPDPLADISSDVSNFLKGFSGASFSPGIAGPGGTGDGQRFVTSSAHELASLKYRADSFYSDPTIGLVRTDT